MIISRQPSQLLIIIDQKQPENADYFNYFVSVITNDESYTREIKSRITMERAHSKRRRVFVGKLDLNLTKKLVKCLVV